MCLARAVPCNTTNSHLLSNGRSKISRSFLPNTTTVILFVKLLNILSNFLSKNTEKNSYSDMCYLEDLRFLHGHTLLLLNPRFRWYRNKRQFKNIPSSTCLTRSEWNAFNMNDRGPEFNAYWVHILFSVFT